MFINPPIPLLGPIPLTAAPDANPKAACLAAKPTIPPPNRSIGKPSSHSSNLVIEFIMLLNFSLNPSQLTSLKELINLENPPSVCSSMKPFSKLYPTNNPAAPMAIFFILSALVTLSPNASILVLSLPLDSSILSS